jgi:transposase InsO family protein
VLPAAAPVKRVERIMRENGIMARRKRPFRLTTDSNHDDPIAPNLRNRDIAPEAPNRVSATDVTYIPTIEGGSTWPSSSTCSRAAWSAGPRAGPTTAGWR